MNPKLFRKLKMWRDAAAKKEGVELFRVLPNRAIEEIAASEPVDKEELISIKGIKEKKFQKYGMEILRMVRGGSEDKAKTEQNILSNEDSLFDFQPSLLKPKDKFNSIHNQIINQKEKIYSVSEFLDYLNEKLMIEEIKLKGEVTSVDEREKVIYFNLKDKKDESVINCLVFRYQYEISGIKLEIGNEIIVNGYPEIYKPYGKLSLKVSLIEITGAGALKKAYENLKKKLDAEGLFALERKKLLPELPRVIGLITSSQGAAIGDFKMNLGKYGFKIKFVNSSVEGKRAVPDLIKAIKRFKKMKNVDVLVIIRGGGSLESLQAFNNEALVREIAILKIPVVCGVGHEKDVSLASLVSDVAVSTPTAGARAVSESWDFAIQKLNQNQTVIINSFEKILYESKREIEKSSYTLNEEFENILNSFKEIKNDFLRIFEDMRNSINNTKNLIKNQQSKIFSSYIKTILKAKNQISLFENIISANNPEKQLRLGYSVVSFKGKIIRSAKQVKRGDLIDVKVCDGEIETEVKSIKK